EPPFADQARKTVRASEPPPNTLGLGLVVTQSGSDLPWLVVVANPARGPARVAADLRLLRLELQEPEPKDGATRKGQPPKPKICEFPDADRPDQPDPDLLVDLEPGLLLAHPIDPRLICEP